MLADVHWRLGLLWQNWPYRLAQLVDPRCSQDEVRRLAEQIFDLPTCCLDAACVRKLRRLYNGADDLLADGDFMDAVRLWSRRARCTNMHIERCFALLRTAVEDPAPMLSGWQLRGSCLRSGLSIAKLAGRTWG